MCKIVSVGLRPTGMSLEAPARPPSRGFFLVPRSHHLAAGRASDRGQPAPARGVESIKSTTFREEPLGAPVSLRSGAPVISLWPNEGSRDPAHLTVLGRGSRLADDARLRLVT